MAILDLLTSTLVFRFRLVVYAILLAFSLVIIIATASMKNEAPDVDCPLYCDLDKNYLTCGSESNCDYPLALAVVVQLFYPLLRFVTLILVIRGTLKSDGFPFTDFMELIYTFVDLIACFLTFVGACILSAGTNSTCSIDGFCESKRYNTWIPSSRTAQIGTWLSTFFWLAVGLIAFFHLFREGKIPCFPGSRGGDTTRNPVPTTEPSTT